MWGCELQVDPGSHFYKELYWRTLLYSNPLKSTGTKRIFFFFQH